MELTIVDLNKKRAWKWLVWRIHNSFDQVKGCGTLVGRSPQQIPLSMTMVDTDPAITNGTAAGEFSLDHD